MAAHDLELACLPAEVISSLRSSFIVTSLASCLTELVQNSLDAGATSIDIGIDLAAWSARVSDKGSGIRGQDLSLLGQRYYTSKCHDLEDLHRIATYGFRGEALASLADAAMLEIVSRHRDTSETYSTLLRGGKRISCGRASAHRRPVAGTAVFARDLFYKWPVKRKELAANLPGAIEEARRTVEQMALTNPSVSFTLVDVSRPAKEARLVSVKGDDGSILGRWRSLWGGSLVKSVEFIDQSLEDLKVDGFFSLHASHSRQYQLIYVNNRILTPGPLHKVINARFSCSTFAQNAESAARVQHLSPSPSKNRIAAKENRSPRKASDRQPVYLLSIRIPGERVDLSLEPAKKVIVLKDEEAIAAKLADLADSFLRKHNFATSRSKRKRVTPSSSPVKVAPRKTRHSGSPTCCVERDLSQEGADFQPDVRADGPAVFVDRSLLRREGKGQGFEQPKWITDALQDWHDPVFPTGSRLLREALHDDSETRRTEAGPMPPVAVVEAISQDSLHLANFIAQVDHKFLLCRIQDKLVLIDQHAADERVRVEQHLAELLRPDVIATSPFDQHILLSYQEARLLSLTVADFAAWGIIIEPPALPDKPVDDMQAHISAIPNLIHQRCQEEPRLLSELVQRHLAFLEERGPRSRVGKKRHLADCPKILVELANSKACRSAIMFNDPLTDEQAERLVAQLADTDLPFQCAHGRPSMLPVAGVTSGFTHEEAIDWRLI